MKIKITSHILLRLSALLLLPLFSLYDYLSAGELLPVWMCLNIWCALQLLLLYPLPHEAAGPSMAASAVSMSMSAGLKLIAAPPWMFAMGGTMLVFLFSLHRSARRFADVPPLFMVSTVWAGVMDYLCLIHTGAYIMTGVWLCVLVQWQAGALALLGLLSLFFGVQYLRIFSRRTLYLGKRKEHMIRQGQKGSGYRLPVQYVDSDSRSAVLFNEVVKIMEVKKPYLQEDFDLDDLSRMTRTNRLYLSKAINFHSGRNFNQLVNYYRVKYAAELIRKDSNLRMCDVAQMSGFHTTVSFNMAFKLNEHTTPSEYARSLKKVY